MQRANADERNPVILAVDDAFADRSESRIGIGDPFESDTAVDGARRGRGFVERRPAQLGCAVDVTCREPLQRLNEWPYPFRRLAENLRCALAGEDVGAQQLAPDRLPVG